MFCVCGDFGWFPLWFWVLFLVGFLIGLVFGLFVLRGCLLVVGVALVLGVVWVVWGGVVWFCLVICIEMCLFVVGWNVYLVVCDCGLFVVFVLFGFGFVLFVRCWLGLLFVICLFLILLGCWVGCLFVVCCLLFVGLIIGCRLLVC